MSLPGWIIRSLNYLSEFTGLLLALGFFAKIDFIVLFIILKNALFWTSFSAHFLLGD